MEVKDFHLITAVITLIIATIAEKMATMSINRFCCTDCLLSSSAWSLSLCVFRLNSAVWARDVYVCC